MKQHIDYLTTFVDLINTQEITKRISALDGKLKKFSSGKNISKFVDKMICEHKVREDMEIAVRDMLSKETAKYVEALREGELIFQLQPFLKGSPDRLQILTELHQSLDSWEKNYKSNIGKVMDRLLQDMMATFESHEKLAGKLKETEESLKRHKELAQQRTESLAHLKADFENYKKRVTKEKEQLGETANEELLQSLLPVLDSFDNALSHVPPGRERDEAWQGLIMIHQLLLQTLAAREVQPIEATGQPFNPDLHEAMLSEPTGGIVSETVLQDMRRGYTYHGKLLRPSMVKVGVPPAEDSK